MIVAEENILVNVPFMFIGLGILLGAIFMILMCRQKEPLQVRTCKVVLEKVKVMKLYMPANGNKVKATIHKIVMLTHVSCMGDKIL